MAAQVAVTLTDAAGTPVNRVFSPMGVLNGLAKWAYKTLGVVAGYNWLSQFLRVPTPQSDAYKATFKLVTPVLEVTSPSTGSGIQPAPTVAYELIANLEFVLPSRSSLQERKDILAMLCDFVANEAQLTKAVEELEPVW